ncbi:MAG: branched-chain amino acid ABC transporter permease [Lachnospiraceae bacterium]|nr:branched-chain amino acid ABC transporter permease [Lachnospiraceae bacterium]
MEKKKTFSMNYYLRYLLFGVVMSLLPVLTNAGVIKTSWLGIIGGTIIYTIAGLGLNLLLGWSGLISLGTAGFMGMGAYISAYVTGDLGLPWELGILLSVVIPLVFGILIGLASLRMEGLYLGIVTLCVSEVLRKTFDELEPVTGGFSGKQAKYPKLLGIFELDQKGTFILLVVIMVLLMMLTYNLANGQLGRALHAMRGSQVAAQAMGVSLLKYRLIAFSLATAYASLSGALYVHFIRFVYPSTWTLPVSLVIMALIVIGGLRSVFGTFIGALIVYAMPDLVLKNIPVIGDINGLSYVLSGVLIILVVLFYPGGVINLFYKLQSLFTGKRSAERAVETAAGVEENRTEEGHE